MPNSDEANLQQVTKQSPPLLTVKRVFMETKWNEVEKMLLVLFPNFSAPMLKGYKRALFEMYRIEPEELPGGFCLDLVDMGNANVLMLNNGKEQFGLLLYPWRQILGLPLTESIVKKLNKVQVATLTLYEVCFHGFTEAASNKALEVMSREELLKIPAEQNEIPYLSHDDGDFDGD